MFLKKKHVPSHFRLTNVLLDLLSSIKYDYVNISYILVSSTHNYERQLWTTYVHNTYAYNYFSYDIGVECDPGSL